MAGSRGDTIPLSGPSFSKGSGRQSLPERRVRSPQSADRMAWQTRSAWDSSR